MNKLIFAFLATFALSLGASAQTEKQPAKKDGTETITIKTSAVCDMCKETIEKAMAYEKGVKTSDLNVETAMLTVTFDPKKTSAEKIKASLNKTGYDADDLPADPKAYDNLNPCCKKGAH
jgi:mercuric ion binding protein